MSSPTTTSALAALLANFSERVNAHPSLRVTLKGWTPAFYIEARDTDELFQIHFDNGRVTGVASVSVEPEDSALLLRGDAAILAQIFSGKLRPLGAYTDGLLEVYGSQKDQIKLDVIALVVWGA